MANRLIGGLPARDRQRILEQCEPVELVFGTVLCDADQDMLHVWFPLTGYISLVADVGGHPPLEMGLIGNEGLFGATLVLGVDRAPLRGIVQGSGSALRMSAGGLRRELRDHRNLRRVLKRYVYVTMAQLSQTAACTRFHDVGARLARWLLLTHDRAHADHFHLTHEFLAGMLGVRRSGITIAAGDLQLRKLIRYTRGRIQVLDRKGLEAAACECYDAVVDDYRKLLAH